MRARYLLFLFDIDMKILFLDIHHVTVHTVLLMVLNSNLKAKKMLISFTFTIKHAEPDSVTRMTYKYFGPQK